MNVENPKKHLEVSEYCKKEEHKSTTPHWIYDSFYIFQKNKNLFLFYDIHYSANKNLLQWTIEHGIWVDFIDILAHLF